MALVEKGCTFCEIIVEAFRVVPGGIIVIILAVIELDDVPSVTFFCTLTCNIQAVNADVVHAQLIELCISFTNA